MQKLVVSILFVLCCVTLGFGQKSKKRSVGMLVDKNKPAVFISLIEKKEFKNNDEDEERRRFFFQITNNTRSNIWLQMSGETKEYGQVRLYYAIKEESGKTLSGSTQCHVCSVNPLASGRSIIFSIPVHRVVQDSFMQIDYSFEWERDNERIGDSYSNHSVLYFFNSLLKSEPNNSSESSIVSR